MLLKEITIGIRRRCDAATSKTGHDLAKHRSMILRLRMPCRPFDAEILKGFAQPYERSSVERARQIVGRVWHKGALSEPGEQIKIFPPHAVLIQPPRGFAECGMCNSERAGVAAQRGQASHQLGIGAP